MSTEASIGRGVWNRRHVTGRNMVDPDHFIAGKPSFLTTEQL